MKNIKNKKGFTLIELIVVLAILGILMLILVPSFLGYADDAKMQVAKANSRTAYTAYKAAVTTAEYKTELQTSGLPDKTKILDEAKGKLGTGFEKLTNPTTNTLELITGNKTCTIYLTSTKADSVDYKEGESSCK